jgi:hypothetical protein
LQAVFVRQRRRWSVVAAVVGRENAGKEFIADAGVALSVRLRIVGRFLMACHGFLMENGWRQEFSM